MGLQTIQPIQKVGKKNMANKTNRAKSKPTEIDAGLVEKGLLAMEEVLGKWKPVLPPEPASSIWSAGDLTIKVPPVPMMKRVNKIEELKAKAGKYLAKTTGSSSLPSMTCFCSVCEEKRRILYKAGIILPGMEPKPRLPIPPKANLKKLEGFELSHQCCSYCHSRYRVKLYYWYREPLCARCALVVKTCPICCVAKPRYEQFDEWTCSLACLKKQIIMEQDSGSKGRLTERLGLNPQLVLCCEAADFYLLNDMTIDKPELRSRLEAKAKYLAEQFSRYMFLAIGGEIRHYEWRTNSRYELSCDSVGEAIKIISEILGEGASLISWLRERSNPYNRIEREAMWEEWMTVSETLGIDEPTLIFVAMRLFNEGSGFTGSVGGENWGNIAKVLLMYWREELNDIAFVDTAFGLKHNGDLHFNKVWRINCLSQLLTANANDNLDLLKKFASEEVLEYTNG